jgi:hypothetical protein
MKLLTAVTFLSIIFSASAYAEVVCDYGSDGLKHCSTLKVRQPDSVAVSTDAYGRTTVTKIYTTPKDKPNGNPPDQQDR